MRCAPALVLAPAILAVSLLAGPGCSDDAGSSTAARERARRAAPPPKPHAEPPAPPEPPRWVLLSWDTKLYTAPERYAPALLLAPPPEQGRSGEADASEAAETWTPPEQRGRVVEVLGKADEAGQWWALKTGTGADPAATAPPIEGLELYALDLYVPAGTGLALDDGLDDSPDDAPKPEASKAEIDPGPGAALPVQTGDARTPSLIEEWHVGANARVYWPNGEVAGEVRRAHAFIEAGEDVRVGNRELTCFAARVGPRTKLVNRLCFMPESVTKTAPPRLDDNPFARLRDDQIEALLGGGLIGTIATDEDPGALLDALEALDGR